MPSLTESPNMSKTLIFHNPGEIDIRGACIAGLSAKDSKSPIGYFGTGLKYAIASILRWGGEVTIYSGTTRYNFEAAELPFRGQTFNQVYMNGAELGFTTEYGKDWEPWQVFRELYSNARDESGDVMLASGIMCCQGETAILVSGVPDLETCYLSRDEIILPEDKHWNEETPDLQFSLSPSAHLYYRGVRVKDTRCHYTWNFRKDIKLTENRTIDDLWGPQTTVRNFIRKDCKDETVIEQMLHLTLDFDPTFEGGAMQFLTGGGLTRASTSPTFQAVALRLYRRDPRKWKELQNLCLELEPALSDLGAVVLSKREEAMLAKAKELVALFGFAEEISTIPITVKDLGPSTLGLYKSGKIYLSNKLFDQGTKQLVATLYEECYHHRTAQQDCTYSMQTDLFNIIISLNEEVHNVIC